MFCFFFSRYWKPALTPEPDAQREEESQADARRRQQGAAVRQQPGLAALDEVFFCGDKKGDFSDSSGRSDEVGHQLELLGASDWLAAHT